MTDFGKRVFDGSRFMFWMLAPIVVFCAIVIAVNAEYSTVQRTLLIGLIEVAAVLFLLSIWPYAPLIWARRGLCSIIFVVYAGHALENGLLGGDPESGRYESLAGLLVIGLPWLVYAVRGRWFSDSEPELPEVDRPGSKISLRRDL